MHPGLLYNFYDVSCIRMFTRSGWERTKIDLMMEVMMHITSVTFCLHYLPILKPNYVYVIISINPIFYFPLPFYFAPNLGELQYSVFLNSILLL